MVITLEDIKKSKIFGTLLGRADANPKAFYQESYQNYLELKGFHVRSSESNEWDTYDNYLDVTGDGEMEQILRQLIPEVCNFTLKYIEYGEEGKWLEAVVEAGLARTDYEFFVFGNEVFLAFRNAEEAVHVRLKVE